MIRALLHHWWLLLLSVLSLISTALTFLPRVHVPRLLPVYVALFLVVWALFRVYSDQCNALESLQEEKTRADEGLRVSEEELEASRRAKGDLVTAMKELEFRNANLQNEVTLLGIKPYDESKLQRTRGLVADLRYFERDLLRLILMNGDTRGDVISNARANTSQGFDLNAMSRPLQERGLVQRFDDHMSGYATFKVNQSLSRILQDVLYPRDEGENKPFFNGL